MTRADLVALIASTFPFRKPHLHTPTCACTDCQQIGRIADAVCPLVGC